MNGNSFSLYGKLENFSNSHMGINDEERLNELSETIHIFYLASHLYSSLSPGSDETNRFLRFASEGKDKVRGDQDSGPTESCMTMDCNLKKRGRQKKRKKK